MTQTVPVTGVAQVGKDRVRVMTGLTTHAGGPYLCGPVGRGPAGSGRCGRRWPGRLVMPWRGRDPLGYPGWMPSLPLSLLP
jgi:hypothetical protein